MTQHNHLKVASFAFALVWTVGMIVWSGGPDIPRTVIWTTCGAVAGFGWYHAMTWFQARLMPRQG